MQTLIVHCHPEAASFNAALTEVAARALRGRGGEVTISDLYAEGFDPREGPEHYCERDDTDVFSPLDAQRHAYRTGALPLDVRREIERLEAAELVIFQFPLWWHAPPALLKGWFDRVFVNGGLYTSSMRYDRGYFVGKRALCSVTAGAPEAAFGAGARGGDIEALLWPLQYSLHYLGFAVLPPFVTYGVQGHGYAYREEADQRAGLERALESWEQRLRSADDATPLRFPGWADWDAEGRAASTQEGARGGGSAH